MKDPLCPDWVKVKAKVLFEGASTYSIITPKGRRVELAKTLVTWDGNETFTMSKQYARDKGLDA